MSPAPPPQTITDFIMAGSGNRVAGLPGYREAGSTVRRDRRVCVTAVRPGKEGKEARRAFSCTQSN